jgi:hypothetical protein
MVVVLAGVEDLLVSYGEPSLNVIVRGVSS